MNARRFLYQIGSIEGEIQKLSDEIIKTESRLTRITPVLSDMPMGGGNNDKIGNGVIELIEWKDRLNRKVMQLMSIQHETLDVIEQINDDRYRTILTGHYFGKEPLTKMAYDMQYDYYYLCALHKSALREFDKHHNKSQVKP